MAETSNFEIMGHSLHKLNFSIVRHCATQAKVLPWSWGGFVASGIGIFSAVVYSVLPPWDRRLYFGDNIVCLKCRAPNSKQLSLNSPREIRQQSDDILKTEAEQLASAAARMGYERFILSVPVRGGDIKVHVFRPRNIEINSPLVVWFHGGGMCLNSAEDLTLTSMCWEGWAILESFMGKACVASVEYRLAPEHKFPTGVEDAISAVRYLHEHARSLKCDPARICVAGHSAGGYLAAVVQQASRDQGFPLSYVVLLTPMCRRGATTRSYLENGGVSCLTMEMMLWYWLHYCPDTEAVNDPRCEPVRGIMSGDLAPCLVVTAEYDALRDEGVEYFEELKAAGVRATHVRLRTTHGGGPCDTDRWNMAMQLWLKEMKLSE